MFKISWTLGSLLIFKGLTKKFFSKQPTSQLFLFGFSWKWWEKSKIYCGPGENPEKTTTLPETNSEFTPEKWCGKRRRSFPFGARPVLKGEYLNKIGDELVLWLGFYLAFNLSAQHFFLKSYQCLGPSILAPCFFWCFCRDFLRDRIGIKSHVFLISCELFTPCLGHLLDSYFRKLSMLQWHHRNKKSDLWVAGFGVTSPMIALIQVPEW